LNRTIRHLLLLKTKSQQKKKLRLWIWTRLLQRLNHKLMNYFCLKISL